MGVDVKKWGPVKQSTWKLVSMFGAAAEATGPMEHEHISDGEISPLEDGHRPKTALPEQEMETGHEQAFWILYKGLSLPGVTHQMINDYLWGVYNQGDRLH